MPRTLTLRQRLVALGLETRTAALTVASRAVTWTVEAIGWIVDTLYGTLTATEAGDTLISAALNYAYQAVAAITEVADTLVSAGTFINQLFYDTFTDTDGTLLTAHTPDVDTVGDGWVAAIDNGRILSNRAIGNTANTLGFLLVNVNDADVTINHQWITPAVSTDVYIGNLIRYASSINYWFWRWQKSASAPQAILVEVTSGSPTVRASQTIALVQGTTYVTQIVTSGNNITVTCGGVSLSYTSTSHNTATRYGLVFARNIETGVDSRVSAADSFEILP